MGIGGAGGDTDLIPGTTLRGALLSRTGDDCLTTVQAATAAGDATVRPLGEKPLAVSGGTTTGCCDGDGDLRTFSSRIGLWRRALGGSPRA